ncbi:hypothetical protein RJ43_14695 [Alteromonas macleodii]|nr:hypothetical protein RJ43_14695 [Alteromonas macleodii]
MGSAGLRKATEVAILNANYVAKKLEEHFLMLYKGSNGRVAHECIIDLRPLKEASGVTELDIAKYLCCATAAFSPSANFIKFLR